MLRRAPSTLGGAGASTIWRMHIAPYVRVWLIFALVCVVTLTFWPSAAVYGAQWSDFVNITYTHGWLIVLVCLALLWRARTEVAATPARLWPVALGVLGVCTCLWLVCYRANNQDLHITVFPLLLWLAIAAGFGKRMALLLAFPVAFFLFAVPSWSQLSVPLQSLTVAAVQTLLRITGPSAEITGDHIRIPNGTFVIEEGCSGLHFLIVGLAIAALNGELRRDPWRTRLAQLVFMLWLALLANWIRVYTVIERGYQTDMQTYLVRVSHYWFGWGVFAVALVVFFVVTDRLGPAPGPDPRPATGIAGTRAELVGLVAVVAVLGAPPALSAALRLLSAPAPLDAAIATQPRPPWVSLPASAHSSWMPNFHAPDLEQRLMFSDGSGDMVEAYAVGYRTQSQTAKLYGTYASLFGRDLRLRAQGIVETAKGTFRESAVADRAGAHFLIWSRYEVAGRTFVNALPSQLWFGLVATLSNPPAQLVAVRAVCAPDCAAARHVLQAFISSGTIH